MNRRRREHTHIIYGTLSLHRVDALFLYAQDKVDAGFAETAILFVLMQIVTHDGVEVTIEQVGLTLEPVRLRRWIYKKMFKIGAESCDLGAVFFILLPAFFAKVGHGFFKIQFHGKNVG